MSAHSETPSPIQRLTPLVILAAATLCLYWPALRHEFLINWDDLQYVIDNPTARGLTLPHLTEAFTRSYLGNYAPLHIISYMLDYQLWGLTAAGFILTNLLLHTGNGLLFYLFLNRLASRALWPLFAALLFLLHPVQVESVVWISQRKNLLAMFFLLTSLLAWQRYREQTPAKRLPAYLLSLAAFCLALLSKSVTVVLPLVLVLYDLCFGRKRGARELLADKLPCLAAAAVCAVAAVLSHSSHSLGGMTAYHGGSPAATFLTMLPVLADYLRMLLWPAGLSAFYDVPIRTGIDGAVAGAALLCLLLAGAGLLLCRRSREQFFWFATFFICLLPVSQIVPIVTLMNDRYLYFPMLGAAPLLCSLLLGAASRETLSTNPSGWVRVALCTLLLTACAAATAGRIPAWKDSYTLWSDTAPKAPGVPLVHDGLGESLLARGQIDEALAQFQLSLKLQPAAATPGLTPAQRNALAYTYNNLGSACGMRGDSDTAIRHFSTAVALDPAFDKAHFNLGNALASGGRLEQALQSFERAVQLNPARENYRANLELTRRLIGQAGAGGHQ